MGKKHLQELLSLLSTSSDNLQSSLDTLDGKVLENIKDLSIQQKLELHKWLSQHLNSKLGTLPNFRIK